jgi:hypothetical protein
MVAILGMSDNSLHIGTDQDGFSAMARQACQLLAQQTDLLKNGTLSDEQRAEYILRQGQIEAGPDQGSDPGHWPRSGKKTLDARFRSL